MLAWVVCTREQPYQNLQSPETVMKEMLMQATPTPPLTRIPIAAPTPTLALSYSPFLAYPSPKPYPFRYSDP